MAEPQLNPKVAEHARHPRNWGELEDANGVLINVQSCGDIIMFFVKVRDNRLEKVRFLAQGCQNLVACCSVTTVLAQGRSIWEAMQLTPEEVERTLGGLPKEERHTAAYATDALYAAIQDYLSRSGRAKTAQSMHGEGWRSLYIQAQRGEQPLPNLYRKYHKQAEG